MPIQIKSKIIKVFGFIIKKSNGEERILSVKVEGGDFVPLICTDIQQLNNVRGLAQEIAQKAGAKYEIRTFQKTTVLT